MCIPLMGLLAFLTPANAMLSVELKHLADVLDATGQLRNVSSQAKEWSTRISKAIWDTTVRHLDALQPGMAVD